MFLNSKINMKFLVFLITVYVLFSSWVNSLVVTKIDMNSFIDYYHKEITEHNVEKIKELFTENDLFKYCDRLRQARIYNAVNTSEDLSQRPSVVHIYFSNRILERERDNAQMQSFNIRLGSSKHVVAFWGFQCANYVKNMSWIVSPAFVPDSAFLFEFQLDFRHLSWREVHGRTAVTARSVAFVDQNGIVPQQNIHRTLQKYKEKLYQRDPLCDLNGVVKYRLCSLVIDMSVQDRHQPLDDLPANNITSRRYTVETTNQYFDHDDSKDRCDPKEISYLINGKKEEPVIREMLHCPMSQPIYASNDQLYINLDPFDPTTILCSLETEAVFTPSNFPLYWQLQIPLLRHINKTDSIYEEINNENGNVISQILSQIGI